MNSFKPKSDWGPSDPNVFKVYKMCMDDSKVELMFQRSGFWFKVYDNIFGWNSSKINIFYKNIF